MLLKCLPTRKRHNAIYFSTDLTEGATAGKAPIGDAPIPTQSQCSTLVRNTVVRAIHTVNGRLGNSTPPPRVQNPWTDWDEIVHGWLRHPPYPTCTIWLMLHNGFRGTVGVKLSHRRAFLCITNIFVVPSHSVQPTLKTLAWSSMHPKVCFGGKLIPRR